MRILYFADGTSVHTLRWAGWFADAGHEVHVASWTPGSDPRFVWHRLATLRETSPGLLKVPVLGSVARERFLAEEARRVAAEVGPDLVHGHFLDGYGHLAHWSGVRPLVLTAWGSDVYGVDALPARQREATRRALEAADAVTVDSRDLAEAVIALGAVAERVSVVPLGVDRAVFHTGVDASALRAELGLGAGAKLVVSPRAMRPQYHLDTIVRACAGLTGVTLVMLDYLGDEDYSAQIRELVAGLGMGQRVRFADALDHGRMAELYALADVVVSLAETDSSPVSVLEAMACGAVVVASDIPGVREWISDGDNGYLAPVDEPGAVSVAIGRALALGSEARSVWARANAVAIAERADWDGCMRGVEALYRDIIGRQTGAGGLVHE